MTQRIGLEICVDSPQGLLDAVANGADRIELCSALALSGTTPSRAFMKLAASTGCVTYAMIRPHSGPYAYGANDLDVMRWEIDEAREAGLAGVVFGANHPSGELDAEILSRLMAHALGLGTTLHRAFDLTPDLPEALELAIELGFERILTSGGARTAPEGVEQIAGLVDQAAGRISIMPGSGIVPATVEAVVRRTRAHEVHGSCGKIASDAGLIGDRRDHAIQLGFITPDGRATDGASVAAVSKILSELAASRLI